MDWESKGAGQQEWENRSISAMDDYVLCIFKMNNETDGHH